jgi:excinuclease UvrABC nuclease subunit
MEIKAFKTKKFKPYYKAETGSLRASFKLKTKSAGCYAIYINNRLYYVGTAQDDVKKTAYRHFQVWQDTRYENERQHAHKRKDYSAHKTAEGTFLKIWLTPSKKEAKLLERYLIVKLNPKDNDVMRNWIIDDYNVNEGNQSIEEEDLPF